MLSTYLATITIMLNHYKPGTLVCILKTLHVI